MQKVSEVILHEYPYPLAKCYEQLVRTRDIMQRRDQVRYLFEATLKYCACLSLGHYLNSGMRDPAIDGALGCLGRPSLGHWLNLFRLCSRFGHDNGGLPFPPATLEKTRGRPAMLEAFNVIRHFLNPERKGNVEAVSAFSFLEALVAYRNRTSGHGTPQREHVEKFTPVIEAGVVDLLLHLGELRNLRLVYVAEIRVERHRFVHTLTRLMGTTPLAMPDYLTSKEEAMLGQDRTLIVFDERNEAFLFTVHPLLIYSSDSVYILQSSDLKHDVEYLCHDTGALYVADQIFEDFKERLSAYITGEDAAAAPAPDGEAIYESCLKVSLLDGRIEADERSYLEDLRERLSIPLARAGEIERRLLAGLPQSPPEHAQPDARGNPQPDDTSISFIVEQQNRLLMQFGEEILRFMSARPNPSQPLRLDELAGGLAEANRDIGGISKPQFAQLLADVLAHGLAPGLVKTGQGYAIVEDHIAYKLKRGRDLKREIARAAGQLLGSGDRIAMDGGSTTLPIAEEIVSALEAEAVGDLTVVTNSLPVAQCFADFVERRGWTDKESPVTILISTGRIRAVTKAIASLGEGDTQTEQSLAALIEHIGGLDYCFVGANGVTAGDAITMPTVVELSTKRQFLSKARQPYIVADVTKFGVRYPVKVAGWDEPLTILTNRPTSANPELDAVLNMPKNVRVTFAE
jgi:DeoR/GlpR family transcriptional regulator of sugar metabolism